MRSKDSKRRAAGRGSQVDDWGPQGFGQRSGKHQLQMRRASGLTGVGVMALLEKKVQHKNGSNEADTQSVHVVAAQGLTGSAQTLPYADTIQTSFGTHNVRDVRAHVGGPAQKANAQMGSLAYATGSSVAFREQPDLHTAAHEAAHVVQQRAGVHLKDGVGQTGDAYEQHADAVADRVVQGKSAEALLSRMSGTSRNTKALQQCSAVQFSGETPAPAVPSSQPKNDGEQEASPILKPEMLERFDVRFGDLTAPLDNTLLKDFLDGMWGPSGSAKSNTQFAGQMLVNVNDTFKARSAYKMALQNGASQSDALEQFKGSFNPTAKNIWAGSAKSTVINTGVDVLFKLTDGTYAKMDGAEIAVDLTYTVGKSLVAEAAATAVGGAITSYAAKQGGAIGAVAGPVGMAVGFAAGALVGSLVDLLMSDKMKARLADFFGRFVGSSGHVAKREGRRIAAIQKAVNATIEAKSPVMERVHKMGFFLDFYKDAKVGIGTYDGTQFAASNAGVDYDFAQRKDLLLAKTVLKGLAALTEVRSKWAFWSDKEELVKNYSSAKLHFEGAALYLDMAQKDGAAMIQAAQSGGFKGKNASYDGKGLFFRRGDTFQGLTMRYNSPRSTTEEWMKGMAFADQLHQFLIEIISFCKNQSTSDPLQEQLKKTRGWSW